MEKDAEKFLQAEETAVELVKTLKQLHTEATSYQTATKELDAVRQQLIGLIESTEKIASGSYEVIKILKEIGALEILNRITSVEKRVGEESLKVLGGLESLKTETFERFKSIENRIGGELLNVLGGLRSLKTEIIERFTSLENKLSKELHVLSTDLENVKVETAEKITKVEKKVSEDFNKNAKSLQNLKIILIITLASSIITTTIGIIGLLR
ncbi:hypothetical protein D9V84_06790 [Bacteroidetes/Chlorobi group bacterium Naka2016]|jgi:hypothetical protein|nr:MAG: hypothetical protein D9V84_06790 [Bacteroidetes/Chlorobi group bacterium Naka2016]